MGSGIFFPLCAIPFSLLVMILFYAKERVKNKETKIYGVLIISNFFGLIIEIFCTYASMIYSSYPAISVIVYKLYLFYIILWISTFSYYIFSITKNDFKINSKRYVLFIVYYLVISIILTILPIDVVIKNDFNIRYTAGLSVDFAYGISAIAIIVILYLLTTNVRKLKDKKYIPVFVFLAIGTVAFYVQMEYPQILMMTYVETLICVIMYFTIENPDLQLLREFHKAREYANNLNTEKSEFLFNMAGEIKTPISVINRISKEVLMQDDINVIKSKVNDIKYSSNNLLELVNKVLDINSLEKRKVSVRESKYNTTNLFKGIESQTELKLNNDLVEFRTNYDKSIPNELYGDSVRIRQIVNTLLENAIKYTKEGFIELSVNSIVKHDICRLVITVEDSGVGMTQDVVEHLFDKELEKIEEIDNPKMDLGLVKTLLDLIGGTIIVNSELNHGTKFTIVLDQKVVNHKKNKTIEAVEKYEEMYLNNKKVMCIINDDTLSKKINTLFKKYQLDIEIVKLGQSCLEKVRALEKFDLIIMEEHLEKLSSENTLAKLKSIQGFKTPVILLTDIKDINEKEEYLKLGFTEIVTLPLKKEQVEELVNNYVQEK